MSRLGAPVHSEPLPMLHVSQARILPDHPMHDHAVVALCDEAFGPGRHVRAAERVREMAPHDRALSFVATIGGTVVGAVRQTPVLVGDRPALMLGPLVVSPAHKGAGIGRTLMQLAADAAAAAGERVIFLVGDRAYYMPLGYRPLPRDSLVLPGPVDPDRILALPLGAGALDGFGGTIRPRF